MDGNGWESATLDDIKAPRPGAVAIGPFGSRMKSDTYTPVGIPVIRGNNLGATKGFEGEFVYVSPEFAQTLGNANVFEGDLVFPHRGSIGEVGIVTGADAHFVLSTSLMKATLDPRTADPLFYFYYFKSREGRHELLKNASQVGTPGIATPLTSLRSVRVPVPPLGQQREIANILGSLDDKIALNRTMNRTLEAMARALFRSWFVDFDPVRAKAEGRAPTGMDADTAALFPDAFEDSPLGPLPKGWTVRELGECCTYLNRGKAPSYVEHSPIRALNQRAIRWWNIDETVLKYHDPATAVREDSFIRRGDVVVNSTGDITIGRTYWFHHEFPDLFADSHVTIARTDRRWLYPEVLTFMFETPTYQDIIYAHVTGSTGQLELNRTNLAKIPVLAAPQVVQQAFSDIIAPWFDCIDNNTNQIRTLATTRDALLPRLMSGEVRVGGKELAGAVA